MRVDLLKDSSMAIRPLYQVILFVLVCAVFVMDANMGRLKAKTLTAGTSKAMTLEETRNLAFEDATSQRDMKGQPSVERDCLSGRASSGKSLAMFDDFCIVRYDNRPVVYYYDLNGVLRKVEFFNCLAFPAIGHVYAYPRGDLEAVRYYASRDETFNFNPDGSFHSRWLGNTRYDPRGQVVERRTDLDY